MTLVEYIDVVYDAKHTEGTAEICGWSTRVPWKQWICYPVIQSNWLQRYKEALSQLKPGAQIIDAAPDALTAPLIEKYLIPATPKDKQEALFEAGRIIISRVQIAMYEGGNYQPNASAYMQPWIEEGFGYPWPGPPRLRWWFKDALHYTEYETEVNIDLVVAAVWQYSGLPSVITATWEAREGDWFQEKLGDIFDFVGDITGVVFEAIFGSVWQFVATVVLFYYVIGPAIVEAAVQDVAVFNAMYGTQVSYMGEVYFSGAAFVEALGQYMGAFLAMIHYDTLIGIHTIAYIISQDYRDMMAEVYTQIAEISTALGYAPEFLSLFLRNTRTLVLDASTRMGMRYDLAEVQWLATLSDYSQILAARAHHYRDNPESLFYDMAQLIERPVADSAGVFSQTIITTVNNTLIALQVLVSDVTSVADGLQNLIASLPEEIQSRITPITGPILAKIDDFVRDTYTPSMATLTSLVDAVSTMQEQTTQDVGNLVDRLRRPADYLLEIDALTDTDREGQEDIISNVASRSMGRTADIMTAETADIRTGLTDQLRLLDEPREPPSWKKTEEEGPIRPAGRPAEIGKTWFIGDY